MTQHPTFPRTAAFTLLLGAALALAAPASTAAQSDGRAERKAKVNAVREACKEDIQRVCSDVKRGRGRILSCLKTNAAELSPICSKALSDAGVTTGNGERAE